MISGGAGGAASRARTWLAISTSSREVMTSVRAFAPSAVMSQSPLTLEFRSVSMATPRS